MADTSLLRASDWIGYLYRTSLALTEPDDSGLIDNERTCKIWKKLS